MSFGRTLYLYVYIHEAERDPASPPEGAWAERPSSAGLGRLQHHHPPPQPPGLGKPGGPGDWGSRERQKGLHPSCLTGDTVGRPRPPAPSRSMSRVLGARAGCTPGSAGGPGRTRCGLAGLEGPRRPGRTSKAARAILAHFPQLLAFPAPPQRLSAPPPAPARLPGAGTSMPGGASARVSARRGPRTWGRPRAPRPPRGRVSGASWEERGFGCGGGHREDAGITSLDPLAAPTGTESPGRPSSGPLVQWAPREPSL